MNRQPLPPFALAGVAVALGSVPAMLQVQTGASGSVVQQQIDSRGNAIEEVVVTANRRPQRIPEIARSVIVLDELVIDENLAKTSNIADLLGASVPGFGPPAVTDIDRTLTLRGRNVQYLIDGVPIQYNGGTGYGGFALAKFDPEIIGRVEVLYGPTSVYGGGATGGVIQYFTQQPVEGDPFQLRLRVQSTTFLEDFADSDTTSYKTTIGASGDLGRFDYLVNYSYDRQRGLIDGEGDLVNPVFYGFTNEDFYFGKVGFDISDSQRIEAFYNFTEFETDRPATLLTIEDDGRATAEINPNPPAGGPSPLSPFNEKTFWNISYTNSDLFGGSLLVQYYDREDENAIGLIDLRAPAATPTWPQGWPDNYTASFADEGSGFRSQFALPFAERWNLIFGFDRDEQSRASDAQVYSLSPDFDQSGDIGTVVRDGLFLFPFELETWGVFAQIEYEVSDKLRLTGGLRYEDVEFEIGAGARIFETTLDGNGNQVSRPGGAGASDGDAWNIGVTWDAFTWASLFANISQGFEVPGLSQVAGIVPPDQELRSNEAVSPQVVDNYEVGLRGAVGVWRYSFAAYFADSELGQNFIYDPVTNQGEYNRSPQENYGFEAVLGWAPLPSVDLLATVSWGEGDFDPDGDGPQGEVPLTTLDIPPWKFTLNGRWSLTDDLGLNALLLVVGDRDRAFDEGVDLYEIDGYTTLDLGLNWNVFSGTLSAQLTNALDETYITPASQTYIGNPIFAPRVAGAPGRALSVAYSLTF
ncbi:MAG: TonB-dependent receptor [Pseudomonadota bacterium]